MLKDVGLDEKDQRIIYNLYQHQKGAIKLPNGLTECGLKSIVGYVKAAWWIQTSSTCTANTYSDGSRIRTTESPSTVSVSTTSDTQMTRQSLLIQKKAFKGSWTSFWMLLLSSDEGLESNSKKTFCMVVSKERQPPTCNIICNGTGIEQVNSFNYLGSMLTSDGRCEKRSESV